MRHYQQHSAERCEPRCQPCGECGRCKRWRGQTGHCSVLFNRFLFRSLGGGRTEFAAAFCAALDYVDGSRLSGRASSAAVTRHPPYRTCDRYQSDSRDCPREQPSVSAVAWNEGSNRDEKANYGHPTVKGLVRQELSPNAGKKAITKGMAAQ